MNRPPSNLRRTLLPALVAALVAATWMNCRREHASRTEGPVTIRVSGAWALYPMMVKWGEEYQKANPGVRIDVSAGGAGKGIADSMAGLVDLGMVSRDIKPEETSQGAVFVPVVKDAVIPVMNAGNPIAARIGQQGLQRSHFADLWIKEKPLTWGQLARASASQKVQVYSRSDACGAAETWAQYLGRKQEDLKGVGVYGDPGLAEAVRKDASGIGYNNLNFAFDPASGKPVQGLMAIPIDVNGNGKVDPPEEIDTKEKAMAAIRSGAYPAPPARDLNLVAKADFKGPAGAFVKWVLTDGQKYVDEAGYIKIADSQITSALAKVHP